MAIILAPMEGILDATMRQLLTHIGGIDRCVTPFIRVTDHTLPKRVFLRTSPELAQGGQVNKVPVYIQLLGDNAESLASNAAVAASLGAPGIDLNFGCPAKTVNRHGGGARVLRDPEQVFAIVQAVRQALPQTLPLSVKIRLGYEDQSLAMDNALAAQAGGAHELIVHGRTKVQGYKPPVYWETIGLIQSQLIINVVANGDVCSREDFYRCQQQSGCKDVMIGRGLLARPDLAQAIVDQQWAFKTWPWTQQQLLHYFEQLLISTPARFVGNLIKQWLNYLQRQYKEAAQLFDRIKVLKTPQQIHPFLLQHQ